MKAWYIIGIVMALIPLFFRSRNRLGTTQLKGTAGLAGDRLSTERRVMWLLTSRCYWGTGLRLDCHAASLVRKLARRRRWSEPDGKHRGPEFPRHGHL